MRFDEWFDLSAQERLCYIASEIVATEKIED